LTATVTGHGFPAKCAAQYLCDPGGWMGRASHGAGQHLAWLAHLAWPAAPVAAAAVAAAATGMRLLAGTRREQQAETARWVEISCPPDAGQDGGAVLWRLLAPRIGAGRIFRRRRTLAWEARATPGGVRLGLWVPPAVPAPAVAAAVQDAWPGARTRIWPAARLPELPGTDMTAIRLRPRAPDWLPVTALDRHPGRHQGPPDTDLLRAVYGTLAGHRSAGTGLAVQILVRPARHSHRLRARAAARRLRGLPAWRLAASRTVLGLADLVAAIDAASPRPSVMSPQVTDPLGPARLRALAAKAAAGPHYEITIRILASGATPAIRRGLVRTVAAGFGLVTLGCPVPADLAARRSWRPAAPARTRWAPGRHWFIACLPEVAAVAHAPAEPARYGIPAAPARRFPPPPEVLAA
jgi:hypothetical protein